jgi:tetratricopeptide (TPR) repeat protein
VTDTPNSSTAEKPKEPEEPFVLTPEILAYENRRNDLIICAGVLLFAFFLGSFRDNHPDIPLRLATGMKIAEGGIPKTDPFTYGAPADKQWINPSWLFDWMLFGVWDNVGDVAAGVIKALTAALAVLPLLFIRHPGPTLWWTAFCAFLAGAGIAPRVYLGPEVVSLVMTSLTLMLWHVSRTTGRQWLLWVAVALSVFWANVDPSVFVGALLLAALGVGEIVQSFLNRSMTYGDRPMTVAGGVQTLVAAVLVFLSSAATPYAQGTLTFPIDWFANVLPQAAHAEREFFGWNSILAAVREGNEDSTFFNRLLDAKLTYAETAWVALIVGAAASFFLNFNRFSAPRLLAMLAAVGLPMLASRYIGPSALVLASVLSLNGQEAFLDAFGAAPRVTRGWVLWSQVGRMATIIGLFIALIVAPTGRIVPVNVGLFGFGFAANTFPDPKSCVWLQDAGFTGRSFIPSAVRLPAMLAWEAPNYKYFIDSRWQLFADPPTGGGPSPLEEYTAVQKTLLEEAPNPKRDVWEPFFRKHNITHIVFDPWRTVNLGALLTWHPQLATVHISDRLVVVANAGLPESHPDGKLAKKLRIDANKLAFNPPPLPKDAPPAALADTRMVGAPTIIDWLWRYRYSTPAGVTTAGLMSFDAFRLDMPGALFEALREVRKGISEQPDNPLARARLGAIYEQLYVNEAKAADIGLDKRFQIEQKRLKRIAEEAKKKQGGAEKNDASKADAGKKDDKAAKKDDDLPVAHGLLRPIESRKFIPLRHFQIMTSYRDAVRAFTPEGFNKYLFREDPAIPVEELIHMADRCGNNGYLDAAVEVFKLAQRKTISSETREEIGRRIGVLEQRIEETAAKIEQTIADVRKQIEEKAPDQAAQTELLVQRMQLYRNNGMPLKALAIFDEASPNNPEIEAARIAAIEMNLELGFAEKAQENLNLLPPNALPRKGDLQYLNAMVLLAAGQHEGARQAMEQSLAEIRTARISKGIDMVDGLLRGAPFFATGPEGPVGPVVTREELILEMQREARLGFEIGLLLIEMGKPKDALKAFTQALETFPRAILYRPIMEYYAELMRKAGVPDVKLPPDPPVYVMDDELAVKFDQPAAPQADEKKADAPKKADAAKK